MDQSSLLRLLVAVLERLQIRYIVTGSVASTAYGEPRFTYDIDVVADLQSSQVKSFSAAFPGEQFYLSEDAIQSALLGGGQFNIIHSGSGLKIDVIVASADPYDRIRLARAHRIRPEPDYEASFTSPEDLIIKKLEFYKQGGSDKHIRDIKGVLKLRANELDWNYLAAWTQRRNVADVWNEIRAQFETRGDS